MSRPSRLSRPVWLTTGLLIGAVVVPAVSLAATAATVVVIRGPSRHSAEVTAAGQLRTTETDPATFAHLDTQAGNTCRAFGPASATRAYVIKHVNIDVYQAGASSVFAGLYRGGCAGVPIAQMNTGQVETRDIALGDGVAVPANTQLYLNVVAGSASIDVYGYTVPAAAVPDTPAIARRIGTPQAPLVVRKVKTPR